MLSGHLFFFVINNWLIFVSKKQLAHSFQDLRNQLLTRFSFIPSFWFQLNLIINTFLFIVRELLFQKYIIFIILNIGIMFFFFNTIYHLYLLINIFAQK